MGSETENDMSDDSMTDNDEAENYNYENNSVENGTVEYENRMTVNNINENEKIDVIMYSIVETIESENFMVTASPELWIKNDILLWPPPGEPIDRLNPVAPGPDWIPIKCTVLKGSIGITKILLQRKLITSVHERQENCTFSV